MGASVDSSGVEKDAAMHVSDVLERVARENVPFLESLLHACSYGGVSRAYLI
jgi:hypothetical protein